MAHSLALEIQERLISHLTGDLTLLEFQDWLVGATWDVEGQNDPKATELTYEIKLALAEHSRGDINEIELRDRLREFVDTTILATGGGDSDGLVLAFDTTSKLITVSREWSVVHTQFEAASW